MPAAAAASENGRRGIPGVCHESFGIPDCKSAYSTSILTYLEQLKPISDSADSLEQQIGEFFSQFRSHDRMPAADPSYKF